MLAVKNRIHGRNVFLRIFKSGKTIRSKYMNLNYSPIRGKHFKVAVIVSRKVSKKAVIRNRIRRRIYELIRQEFTDYANGYNLIFTVFSNELAVLKTSELKKIIEDILKKVQ